MSRIEFAPIRDLPWPMPLTFQCSSCGSPSILCAIRRIRTANCSHAGSTVTRTGPLVPLSAGMRPWYGESAAAFCIRLKTRRKSSKPRFLSWHVKPQGSKGVLQLPGWLHQTARHLALNARTAKLRRLRHEAQSAPKTAADPVDEISVRETGDILGKEMDRLSAVHREAILLCLYEGVTQGEAAKRLGCSLQHASTPPRTRPFSTAQSFVRTRPGPGKRPCVNALREHARAHQVTASDNHHGHEICGG